MLATTVKNTKQYIISQRLRPWLPIEYYIEDFITRKNIFYASHKWTWKSRIDVYQIDGTDRQILFSIKARNLLTFTYEVVDHKNQEIGLLILENWYYQSWQIIDTQSNITAQLIRKFPSLDEEYLLSLEGQEVCLFSEESGFFKQRVHLYCLAQSKLNFNLILSVGILLLAQRGGSGGDGAGSG